MADDLERVKRKRSTIRSLITRLLHKIEKELSEEPFNVADLEDALSQLTVKENLLTDLDQEIEHAISDLDELEVEITVAQEYQERVLAMKCRTTRALKVLEQGIRDEQPADLRQSATRPAVTVRLPRLSINTFDGDASAWHGFWCQFDAAVNQNETISKVDKFNYLKSYLEGTAANAISGLSLTNDNYDAAIKIISERFGRKDIVVNSHMKKLLALAPVRKSSDLTALRKLYDQCEVQVRSLESLGVISDMYGSLLCPILMKVIPDDIALEFSRRRDLDGNWNVTELLIFLRREIESRERAFCFTNSEDETKAARPAPSFQPGKLKCKQEFGNRYVNFNREGAFTAAALNMTAGRGCCFCGQMTHKAENCKIMSIEEKKEKLRKQGRCFICLMEKHIARFCRSKVACSNCGRKHNKAICDQSRNVPMSTPAESERVSDATMTSVSQKSNFPRNILLQTANALAISQNNADCVVRCLLDGGSQRTFVKQDISRKLGFSVLGFETLNIHTFGSETAIKNTCKKVRLVLASLQDPKQWVEIEALEIPQICSSLIQVPEEQLQGDLKRKGLVLADGIAESGDKPREISVLIGADYYWKVATGKMERLTGSLVALETKFGWSLHGPMQVSSMTVTADSTHVNKIVTSSAIEEEEISCQLRSFWELDSLGITDGLEPQRKSDDEAQRMFESSVKGKNGRYEVRLPWKLDREPLADNRIVAENRMKSLIRRFRRDLPLYAKYKDIIEAHLREGIAEEINEEDAPLTEQVMYYMPHQPVIRMDKATTKVRVVFDASSHKAGTSSLNDCLLSGANLNPDLLGILIRFREKKIAFIADIEKAFLQISISDEDRNAVRFLWIHGLNDSDETKFRVLRMTRVVFGVTSSPFLLTATIKHHLKQYADTCPDVCELLNNSLYVDDLIAGAGDVDESLRLSTKCKAILKEANMNLRKWQTNSEELKRLWEPEYLDEGFNIEPPDSLNQIKVLGIVWEPNTDVFTFQLKSLLDFTMERVDTKRFVLQASARIFDPIGLISPFTMRVKCIFQELWQRGMNWDEALPKDLKLLWEEWCSELKNLQEITMPRFYFQGADGDPIQEIEFHCFSDASEKAYGAVLFLRYVTKGSKIKVCFVSSRTRIAPLKKLTLPRLELMAALIGARLTNYIKNLISVKITRTRFWSDSMIALFWIRGSAHKWKPFVENRVREIQALSEPQTWAHCSGAENPADLLSRGQHVEELKYSKLWWTGPNWLELKEENWPARIPSNATEETIKGELRACSKPILQASCKIEEMVSKPILQLQHYSSILRVHRITAWIQRFIRNLKDKLHKSTGALTAEELAVAEKYWIKQTQIEGFPEEHLSLSLCKQVMHDSKISDLSPFVDEDGLIRLGGRLQNSNLAYTEKHPLIMPGKHKYTNLLINAYHCNLMHLGTASTLAGIREFYWIMKGRQAVKRVIQRCIVCRRFGAKPGTQDVAPLPQDRIVETPPFEITGVDFAGPLYLKGTDKTTKAYIAVFTCAVTRAVHLELVSDLTTERFLMAFRKFISRRGICRTIYSDNAQTFKRADKELSKIWKQLSSEEMQNFFGKRGIKWKFIVERAAWWGGFWERMIRSVKTCLRKTLGKALLSFEDMEVIISEVEAILNSRPLTFTYNDAKEPVPLTPSHFLIGRRLNSLPPISHTRMTISATRDHLTRRMKYRQDLVNRFWVRWRKEYLLDLRSAHSCDSPKKNREIKLNDVVLIKEDMKPKHVWKMGRKDELFTGRDGKVRSCKIQTSSGSVIKRPIQLLYPLEIADEKK